MHSLTINVDAKDDCICKRHIEQRSYRVLDAHQETLGHRKRHFPPPPPNPQNPCSPPTKTLSSHFLSPTQLHQHPYYHHAWTSSSFFYYSSFIPCSLCFVCVAPPSPPSKNSKTQKLQQQPPSKVLQLRRAWVSALLSAYPRAPLLFFVSCKFDAGCLKLKYWSSEIVCQWSCFAVNCWVISTERISRRKLK